jgi:hypothetical protein
MFILVLYANVEHHVKKYTSLKNKNNACQHEKRCTKQKLTTLNN